MKRLYLLQGSSSGAYDTESQTMPTTGGNIQSSQKIVGGIFIVRKAQSENQLPRYVQWDIQKLQIWLNRIRF